MVQVLPIHQNLSNLYGGENLSEDKVRDEGFTIFKKGLIRRLSPTHYVVKASDAEPWQLVELSAGKWRCDCEAGESFCVHLYAAQLNRSTSKLQPELTDESHLKCRYCGSLDVAGCGFRYGARGISKRFVCHDCLRKFSIPYTNASAESKPQELTWLLNQVGQLTSKLTDLLQEINARLEILIEPKSKNSPQMERQMPSTASESER
jgi:transposase-like protein